MTAPAGSVFLIIFSFIGASLTASIVTIYWRAKNWPVLLSLFWLTLVNIVNGVNVILWSDNVDIKATSWCEFASRVDFVSTFALVVAAILLLRRLEAIAATRSTTSTASSRRRQAILELGLGLGLPVLYIVLAAFSQGHRFDIAEGLGCMVYIFITPVAIALTSVPPLIASGVAFVYAALCMRWLVLRRQQFKAVLHASASGIDKSHYIRLFGLTVFTILATVPNIWIATINALVNSTAYGIRPYDSWASVHSFYGRIVVYPLSLINMSPISQTWYRLVLVGRWSQPLSAVICFLFLGTSQECRRLHGKIIAKCFNVLRLRGQDSTPPPATHSSSYILSSIEEKAMPVTPQSSKGFPDDLESLDGSEGAATRFPGARSDNSGQIHVTVHKMVHQDGEQL